MNSSKTAEIYEKLDSYSDVNPDTQSDRFEEILNQHEEFIGKALNLPLTSYNVTRLEQHVHDKQSLKEFLADIDGWPPEQVVEIEKPFRDFLSAYRDLREQASSYDILAYRKLPSHIWNIVLASLWWFNFIPFEEFKAFSTVDVDFLTESGREFMRLEKDGLIDFQEIDLAVPFEPEPLLLEVIADLKKKLQRH